MGHLFLPCCRHVVYNVFVWSQRGESSEMTMPWMMAASELVVTRAVVINVGYKDVPFSRARSS